MAGSAHHGASEQLGRVADLPPGNGSGVFWILTKEIAFAVFNSDLLRAGRRLTAFDRTIRCSNRSTSHD